MIERRRELRRTRGMKESVNRWVGGRLGRSCCALGLQQI
jgi:hypothetical protein